MIKTICDYPFVAGEISRRNQIRKRGLSRWLLLRKPYCEVLSKTGAPTCMNRSTRVIDGRAACDECFERVMKP